MVRDPIFHPGKEFVGFYCDLRDLARLTATLDSPALQRDDPDRSKTGTVFDFGASLHLLIELTADLIEARSSEEAQEIPQFRTIQGVLTEALFELCDRNLGFNDLENLDEAWAHLLDAKNDFYDALYDARSHDEILEACYVALRPVQVVHSFHLQLEKRRSNMRVAWLLDQLEALPPHHQRSLNSLLARDVSDFTFTIAAATPYSFEPSCSEGPLRPGSDFELTPCEYFVGEEQEYVQLLDYAWERLEPDAEPLHSILLGGPKYLATMSGRSVRRFLEFCRSANAHRTNASTLISRDTQREVVQGAATALQEDLRTGGDIPQGSLWRLANIIHGRSIANKGKRGAVCATVGWTTSALGGAPPMEPSDEEIVKHGFREGAFLFLKPPDVRFHGLPEEWAISPLLMNVSAAPVDWGRKVTISEADVHSVNRHAMQASKHSVTFEGLTDVRKVFLSLSFKNIAQQEEAQESFRQIFGEKGVSVIVGSVAGAGMIDEIARKIYESDFTVADITYLSSNIVLEIGLTYGLGHRVYPISEATSRGELPLRELAFLLNLGVLRYSLEEESLRRVRDNLLSKARLSVAPSHILVQSFTRPVKLRVKQSGKCLCLYYPKSRRGIWQRHLGEIQGACRDRGIECLVPQLNPHHAKLSILDNLLWSICKADRVLIDTSGQAGPDDLGAFGLGYSAGLNLVGGRKDIRRLEEAGLDHPNSLVMWPKGQSKTWENGRDLMEYVNELVL
jgi:hypothetical protein